MKEWAIEDIRKVMNKLSPEWDQLSEGEKQDFASSMAGNSRDIDDVLRFIEWIRYFQRREWPGYPPEQKSEIATRFPQVADDVETIERAARTYVQGAMNESDHKREDKIVGLCLDLSDELEACEHLAFGRFDQLREALNRVKVKSGSHRRQPKNNARQDARNVFMMESLDLWLGYGGETGGENSLMIAFFQTIWPKQLIRNIPTPAAIKERVYTRQRNPDRVTLELIRRVLALHDADSQEERQAAMKRLKKFETRHPEAVEELRNGTRR
jgi:hypothetical protein